jgi:16S rRNA (cytosine1402-N4)-methyltransferase
MSFSHIPVLQKEAVGCLDIKPNGIYADATAGGGGHSSQIAQKLKTGRLLAIDKDPDAVSALKERFKGFGNVDVVHDDFRNIKIILSNLGIKSIDGLLLDLGVSSRQLDEVHRGFSYSADAPLDMRMSQTGISAYDIVNGYEPERLAKLLFEFGEERHARRIALAIAKQRAGSPIETTGRLAEIIRDAIPAPARRSGGHPAKRSFQAIRIEVNGELDALEMVINDGFELLAAQGRLAIITFHSLEDRIVKHRFKKLCQGCTCPPSFPVCVCENKPRARPVSRGGISPGEDEIKENPRSKSARLRCIEKI